MRTLQPLGNHVLVDPVELPEKSIGGIYVPEQARDRSGEGTVMSVGPGKLDSLGRPVAPQVNPGDRVMYSWIHGRDVKIGSRIYKLLDADELLGVFHGE